MARARGGSLARARSGIYILNSLGGARKSKFGLCLYIIFPFLRGLQVRTYLSIPALVWTVAKVLLKDLLKVVVKTAGT